MKKFVSIFMAILLCFTLSLSVFAYSGTCTIYAPDGRTASIPSSQLASYLAVGWYDYPVVTMFAPDGRTIVVSADSVTSWKAVGWYEGGSSITIYAPDGRTASIYPWQLASYKSVGWYDYPVTTLYAPDGRTIVVSTASKQQWISVGWNPTPVYNKDTFLKAIEGWWVDLTSCRQPAPGIVALNFLNFSSGNMREGATYSEFHDYQVRNITFIGNNTYRVAMYFPGEWWGTDYEKPFSFEWTFVFRSETELVIYGTSGVGYTYTFVGKYHDYNSIQRHPLVVEAAR